MMHKRPLRRLFPVHDCGISQLPIYANYLSPFASYSQLKVAKLHIRRHLRISSETEILEFFNSSSKVCATILSEVFLSFISNDNQKKLL